MFKDTSFTCQLVMSPHSITHQQKNLPPGKRKAESEMKVQPFKKICYLQRRGIHWKNRLIYSCELCDVGACIGLHA